MMAWAAIFGVSSVYLGLLASYHFNLAAGSTIVLTATLIFFAVFFVQNARSRNTHQVELPPA
jgi:ABC-type Mn2+/Zn2+ transport system permease subunit